jgi:putative hydrolase of the HAD superfamily
MKIRAVLFDLDGTLLNRRVTFRRHLQLQVQRLDDLFSDAGGDLVERMLVLDDNGSAPRHEFYHRIAEEFSLPGWASARLLEDFEAHFPESCVPVPNLSVTLNALRKAGLQLGLITNGRVLIQGRKIDGLGIRHLLDVVVISESAGVRKPDPRIFADALSRLGVVPSAAAYVGDNPEVDVLGAKRSGLVAIWKRDTFWTEPSDCDYVIADLNELPSVVLASAADSAALVTA